MSTRIQTTLSVLVLCALFAAPAFAAVNVNPYPVEQGEDVTIKYDPTDRPIEGAWQVYIHYGFNDWGTVINPDPAMSWNSGESVWEITVSVPSDATQLDMVFHDGGGNWDNNGGADWHMIVVGDTEGSWTLNGELDAAARLVATNNGVELYAGLRGTTLYVAAPAAGNGFDHLIFVAETPGAATAAPWDKVGTVAGWNAYVGNENDNGWIGWFDATGTTDAASGNWMEATIDLEEELGSMPDKIHLAFAPYGSEVDGTLDYSKQVAASFNDDGNVDAEEYLMVNLRTVLVGCHPVDLDGDCDADLDDYAVFAGCHDGPDVAYGAGCDDADFDLDGDVDLDDFAFFQKAFFLPVTEDYDFVAEDMGENVTRFYPTGLNINDLPPSFMMESEPTVVGPATGPFDVFPTFTYAGGRDVALFALNGDESLYGTGEVYGELLRNGYTIECWNSDRYAYGADNPSLYQSHPWVMVVRPDGTSYGILADTTWRCRIDLNMGITFAAEGGQFPLYVFEGDTPQDVITRLTDFIGRMELPPMWALGYQQSRYSYDSESYAFWVANGFRDRDIPCDVIWFDIDYMDGYKVFTWNYNNFGDLTVFNQNLHNMNFKAVYMIDPGVKIESGYHVYDSGSAGSHWVLNSEGGSWYQGEVWPGQCHFPDYTRPETLEWWAGLYEDFMATGIDGVWNDMNEPGIFDGPDHSMPESCWHRGGGGIPAGPHSQYHNVYGFLMSLGTYEGILDANPDKRPFVLSRASFMGGHRHAAMWTGDNRDTWEHLWFTNAMISNIGLSGQAFCGPDIGGFAGPCSDDLLARWMGVGTFMPFCRTHYAKGSTNREPWERGAYVESICKTSIERRYRMMPYFYTVFREAAETGLPVLRPAFFADLTNPDLRDEHTAFLIGSDLLIVPDLYEFGTQPTPDHPSGIWRTISLVGENSSSDQNLPDVKIRGGAIVPLGPVMEYTNEVPLNPLTLTVCLNESGFAEGYLYEDDGDGFDYRTGDYRLTHYTATQNGSQVTVEIAGIEGTRPPLSRNVTIDIVTDSGVVSTTVAEPASGVIAVINL